LGDETTKPVKGLVEKQGVWDDEKKQKQRDNTEKLHEKTRRRKRRRVTHGGEANG
jgi:hypothetical protein